MNILLEAIHELNKLDIEEKYKLPSKVTRSFENYLAHFTNSIASLFSILNTQTLYSSREGSKNEKGFISLSSADLYALHRREPEKFPCGIIFDKNSFLSHLPDSTDNNKNDNDLIIAKRYHDIAYQLENGKTVRVSWIAKVDEYIYLLKFLGFYFTTPILISPELYNYIKEKAQQKNLIRYIKHNNKPKDEDIICEEYIALNSLKKDDNNVYITTNSEYDQEDTIYVPEELENDLIYGDTDEHEIAIQKRGLHKKGLPQKKYKVPISYKFDANDVVEIVLPKEYEYLKNDKTPVNKELLDKTTENKRYEKKDLAEFSDEDLVRLIIHFYGNKQITFI